MEVDHINHIRNDNRSDNLQWISHKDNITKSYKLESYPHRKLSNSDAREIRKKYKNGHKDFSEYGINKTKAKYIFEKIIYKFVED